jgi:hypothetical protein
LTRCDLPIRETDHLGGPLMKQEIQQALVAGVMVGVRQRWQTSTSTGKNTTAICLSWSAIGNRLIEIVLVAEAMPELIDELN